MTNLTRSNFQAHPFHLVSPSPWPLFTCIALFTLTTAGEHCVMPALNQTICWNTLFFELLGRSAGNLLAFDLIGILRDYTLEFFCCITAFVNSVPSNMFLLFFPGLISWNQNLGHYLSGLIEADGTIIVPKTERSSKGRLYYPYIQIIFDSRDLPLALLIQKNLRHGSISKRKGANAYVLSFSSKESIILIVSLINGKMRTPKINALYGLIDWLNNQKSQNSIIQKLPINSEPLGSNPWLSGFIEGDGHFSVRATLPNKKINYPKVECRIELVQRQIYHNGLSNYNFMQDIAIFLDSSINEGRSRRTSSKHPQYRVRTISLASNIKLENYLNKYPLFSSKYLNYLDWLKILEFKKTGKYDQIFLNKVIEIKNNMNNKRTFFVWDHLQGFYNLENKI